MEISKYKLIWCLILLSILTLFYILIFEVQPFMRKKSELAQEQKTLLDKISVTDNAEKPDEISLITLRIDELQKELTSQLHLLAFKHNVDLTMLKLHILTLENANNMLRTNLELHGNPRQFESFLSSLSKLPFLFSVESMTCQAAENAISLSLNFLLTDYEGRVIGKTNVLSVTQNSIHYLKYFGLLTLDNTQFFAIISFPNTKKMLIKLHTFIGAEHAKIIAMDQKNLRLSLPNQKIFIIKKA